MARPAQSLMAQLAERRRDRRRSRRAVAEHLGVALSTVTRWEYGHNSPKFRYVVGYAAFVEERVVLRAGQCVLAEGLAIPGSLPALRKVAGLTQRQMAPILHVGQPAVALFETRDCAILSSVEVYAAALGLTFGLEELAEVLANA